MRATLLGLGLTLAATPALALAGQASPPPPIVFPSHARGDAPTADQFLLNIPTHQVICDGALVQPVYANDLPVQISRLGLSAMPAFSLSFSVDSEGRTRDIRPTLTSAQDAAVADDGALAEQQAVLAVWRFDGAPRSDCRLKVDYVAKPIAEANQGELLRYYAVTRTQGPVRDAVSERLAGSDANCGPDRWGGRSPRNVSYPDNRIGERPPRGGRSWTVVRWNVDAEGRATDVETLGSSQDTAFDVETRRAVSETTIQAGQPMKGCVYNFYRTGDVLPAPPLPSRQEDPLQSCPADVGARFRARIDPESFPKPFRDRNIEGWALVRFDMATWGQVGNVTVIEAQPAAAFGLAGRRLVQASQADPAFNAGIRCVVPINYRTPPARVVGSSPLSDNAAD